MVKIKFIQFALEVAILECSFLKHIQGILGIKLQLISIFLNNIMWISDIDRIACKYGFLA
jgi:hypothetical protein